MPVKRKRCTKLNLVSLLDKWYAKVGSSWTPEFVPIKFKKAPAGLVQLNSQILKHWLKLQKAREASENRTHA